MLIFRIKTSKVWHIPHSKSDLSWCSNASIAKDWYRNDRDASTVEVKERDGEILCNACVGMAYKAGVIEVIEKEVVE